MLGIFRRKKNAEKLATKIADELTKSIVVYTARQDVYLTRIVGNRKESGCHRIKITLSTNDSALLNHIDSSLKIFNGYIMFSRIDGLHTDALKPVDESIVGSMSNYIGDAAARAIRTVLIESANEPTIQELIDHIINILQDMIQNHNTELAANKPDVISFSELLSVSVDFNGLTITTNL